MDVCKAGAALETLVHQFSDPLSFYRELIQNALDAGSVRVDVRLFQEGAATVVEVADQGEGMTAEILDTKLTRLFSSGKEGDLTRIGKFGIGFVSVFALGPKAVVVDTSRDGENWRVVFRQDRTFARMASEEALEGTRVRLYLEPPPENLEARSRQAIRFWCRHARGEIRFQGELLNEPFDVDSPCKVRRSRPGLELVAGYAADGRGLIGFHNGGLTLLESADQHAFPGVLVKVDSRYLEHTLTRDGIVQDEHFARLMDEVRSLVTDELPGRLLDLLAERPEDPALLRAAVGLFGPPYRRRWTAAELSHRDGQADGGDWVAVPGRHMAGHVCYGPYLAGLPHGVYTATFEIELEGREEAALLDVHDAAAGKVLASARVSAGTEFRLSFQAPAGASLEFRTWWHGGVPLRQRGVVLTGGERLDPQAPAKHGDRILFRTPAGEPVRLREVLDGKVLAAGQDGPLARALAGRGFLVVLAAPGTPAWELLETLLERRPVALESEWVLPEPLPEGEARPLLEAVGALLRREGARVSEVRLARLPGRTAGVVPRLGEPAAVAELDRLRTGLFASPSVVLVNPEDSLGGRLVTLSAREPELAAWLLAKALLRPEIADGSRLARRAWEDRCRTS